MTAPKFKIFAFKSAGFCMFDFVAVFLTTDVDRQQEFVYINFWVAAGNCRVGEYTDVRTP